MKKLIGFILIWLAVGMLFVIFLPNEFVGILLAAIFILVGYKLFTSEC